MNRINTLFGIEFPVIQAGMVWCSGWKLASAVSNAGGLGLIGAGSMRPEVLKEHLQKCKAATTKQFGVNVPLLYRDIDQLMDVIVEEGVRIVFTSAGNPKIWTSRLQANGIKVVHVVSSVKFALKSQEAGCDAVAAEGFEAGGHNGREETTTFCLVPMVRNAIEIPLIAAGGIGDGRGILGAFALGAEGVQIGSRFAATEESSAHPEFKRKIVEAQEGDTRLLLKSLTPVRLLKNKFSDQVFQVEQEGAGSEELKSLLGKGRARKGMLEGDLEEGELEVGQISASIQDILPAGFLLKKMWDEYLMLRGKFCD